MQKSLILGLLLITLFSCSKEEAELTLEEKLIGNWSGLITQEDCCTFKIDVRINELIANEEVASGNYYDSDHSICNDDVYYCDQAELEPAHCNFSWRYLRSSASSITLFEEHADTDVCASGTITLSFIDDNTINYKFGFTDLDDDVSGTMTRQ